MANVISFTEFTPPARYDGTAFTSAEVHEAESLSGPWSLIDTIALSPVDVDASAPATRNLTTPNGTLSDGWYRLTWIDGVGGEFVGYPIRYRGSGSLITVADVEDVLGREFEESELSRVESAIDAGVAWAKRYLRNPNLEEVGEVTFTFYDVSRDVDLPGVTPTAVSGIPYPGASAQTIDADRWYYTGRMLVLEDKYGDLGLPDEEQRLNDRTWHKVVITANAPDTVDPQVRLGIALASASVFTRQESAGRGLRSENLGDYSYQLDDGSPSTSDDPFFGQAKSVLRGFRRRSAMVVP